MCLMHAIRCGYVKKVIVYKLDRVSRSLIDFVDMLHDFNEYNVEFVSSQECFDTSSPYGEMICKLLMVFAEFERTSIVNRIRDAYDKRSNLGLYAGGRRTYGYNLEETIINGIKTKKYIANKDEAVHIQYIFEIYSQPAITLRMLQADLLGNGIKPLYGADWTTGKLGTILRNPIYVNADADIYEYYERHNTHIVGNLEDFDGKHNIQLYGKTNHDSNLPDWSDMKVVVLGSMGLVDSATWLKCQHKLEQNKQIGNAMSNTTTWLSGKLVCSKCGHKMTTVKSGKMRYFLCSGKTNKKTCNGTSQTVYVGDIEGIAEKCIEKRLESLNLSRGHHSQEKTAQLNDIKLKIKALEQKLSSLGETALSSAYNDEMISVLNAKAKALVKDKQKYLEAMDNLMIETDIIKKPINFAKKWVKADFKQKRAVANVLIKTIIMYENSDMKIEWNI